MLYNTLTQLRAKNLDDGKYADGQGLGLIKLNKVAGKWLMRVVIRDKRREMGLAAGQMFPLLKHVKEPLRPEDLSVTDLIQSKSERRSGKSRPPSP